MSDHEVRRIAELLSAELRSRKVTKRSIEQRMGWSHGYMTRLTSGAIELKLRHVFEVLEVVGVSPAEFFLQAYAPQGAAAREWPLNLLAGTGPRSHERLMLLGEDELERRIESVIKRLSLQHEPAWPDDETEPVRQERGEVARLERPRSRRSRA